MDTNTGESPGHQSQSQQLGNSPSDEEMGHWTPTGAEPTDFDDYDDCKNLGLKSLGFFGSLRYFKFSFQIS